MENGQQFNDLGDIGRAANLARGTTSKEAKLRKMILPFVYGDGIRIVDSDVPESGVVSIQAFLEWAGRAQRMPRTSALTDAEKVLATAVSATAYNTLGEGQAPLIGLTISRGTQTRAGVPAAQIAWKTEFGNAVSRQFKAPYTAGGNGEVGFGVFLPHEMVSGEIQPSFARLRTSVASLTVPVDAFGAGVPAAAVPLSFADEGITLTVSATGAPTGMGFTIEGLSILDARLDFFWQEASRVAGLDLLQELGYTLERGEK